MIEISNLSQDLQSAITEGDSVPWLDRAVLEQLFNHGLTLPEVDALFEEHYGDSPGKITLLALTLQNDIEPDTISPEDVDGEAVFDALPEKLRADIESADSPPWLDTTLLSRLVQSGLTPAEVDAIYRIGYGEAPGVETIWNLIEGYGIHEQVLEDSDIDRRRLAKYSGRRVPIHLHEGPEIEYPIPTEIQQRYNIGGDTVGRYFLEAAPTKSNPNRLAFRVEVKDDGESDFANERLFGATDTVGSERFRARIPRPIAQHSGLVELANQGPSDKVFEQSGLPTGNIKQGPDAPNPLIADLTPIDDTAFRIEVTPSLDGLASQDQRWNEREAISDEVQDLKPLRKSVAPVFGADENETGKQIDAAERDPDTVRSYRLFFPKDYRDAYGIEAGDVVDIRVNTEGTNGEQRPAMLIDFQSDRLEADDDRSKQPTTRKIQSYEAGRYEDGERQAETSMTFVYLPSAVVNALDGGLTNPQPTVRIVPHDTYVSVSLSESG